MTTNFEMTIFEITGDEIAGGDSPSQNLEFHEQLNQIQTAALKIGRTLGMAEVSLGTVRSPLHSFGFRFAASSADRFDVKGVETHASADSASMIKRLR